MKKKEKNYFDKYKQLSDFKPKDKYLNLLIELVRVFLQDIIKNY